MIIFSNLTNKSNKIQSMQKSDSIKNVYSFPACTCFFSDKIMCFIQYLLAFGRMQHFFCLFFYHNPTIFFAPSLTPRETEACDIMGWCKSVLSSQVTTINLGSMWNNRSFTFVWTWEAAVFRLNCTFPNKLTACFELLHRNARGSIFFALRNPANLVNTCR